MTLNCCRLLTLRLLHTNVVHMSWLSVSELFDDSCLIWLSLLSSAPLINRSSGSSPAHAEHFICLPQILIRHKQTKAREKKSLFVDEQTPQSYSTGLSFRSPTKLTKLWWFSWPLHTLDLCIYIYILYVYIYTISMYKYVVLEVETP